MSKLLDSLIEKHMGSKFIAKQFNDFDPTKNNIGDGYIIDELEAYKKKHNMDHLCILPRVASPDYRRFSFRISSMPSTYTQRIHTVTYDFSCLVGLPITIESILFSLRALMHSLSTITLFINNKNFYMDNVNGMNHMAGTMKTTDKHKYEDNTNVSLMPIYMQSVYHFAISITGISPDTYESIDKYILGVWCGVVFNENLHDQIKDEAMNTYVEKYGISPCH